MRRIFVDLEMNPVAKEYEEVRKKCSIETIEIGAVMLDEENQEIASFRKYIRPDYNTNIQPHIQKLTGITWDMVGQAGSFTEVMDQFVRWCGSLDYTIYSWSDNDILQILQETELKGVKDIALTFREGTADPLSKVRPLPFRHPVSERIGNDSE